MLKVAVAGATGYVGGEILRLLMMHPQVISNEITLGALTGSSHVGATLGEFQGHIPQLADRVVTETTVENLLEHDIVFFALPHGNSAAIAAQLPPDIMLIDCGADHRLSDAEQWDKFYSGNYPGYWPYGLPEIPGQREKIMESRRVAIPGCYPTAAIVALIPLVVRRWCVPHISVTGISGTSGAGRSNNPALTSAEILGSMRAYNVAGSHRHIAEMDQWLSELYTQAVDITFTPVLVPASRGILAVCTTQTTHSQAEIYDLYMEFYAKEEFINVLPPGQLPKTGDVLGANMVQISVNKDDNTGVLTVLSAIDNLTKGTAGAAIQCLNLMLDYPENSGLTLTGLAP